MPGYFYHKQAAFRKDDSRKAACFCCF